MGRSRTRYPRQLPFGALIVFAPIICAAGLLLSAGAPVHGAVPGAPRPAAVNADVARSHILVKLMPATDGPAANAADRFADQARPLGVSRAQRLVGDAFHDPVLARDMGLDRVFRVSVLPGTDVAALVDALNQWPTVEYAELDGLGGIADVVPDDPGFVDQWALRNTGQTAGLPGADVSATEAWEFETGFSNPVTIAIVDSGVAQHLDFAAKLVPGINTADPDNPTTQTGDGCPHGTHVAGIAAATGNNAIGIAGMSWGASIMPVRVLTGCNGTESACAAGIIWAADNGADICNMSLQYYTGTQTLRDAVDYAAGLGVTLVAAAGNFQGDVVAFPARFDNCIAVSATNHNDLLYSGSNFGEQIDFSAPGDDVWSTWPGNTYTFASGTSMAAPHVAGLAALMLSHDPLLTPATIREYIAMTTDDLGPEGWDEQFGQGRINAGEAMAKVNDPLSVGACCGILHDCEVMVDADCASGFLPGASCGPFPCPQVPQVTALGGRYIEIVLDPVNGATPVALLIDSDDWDCGPLYVTPSAGRAEVDVAASFVAAEDWGTQTLADLEITPGTTYEIRADYGSYLSDPVEVTTWQWGDVDNSSVVNFADIQLAIQVFQGNTLLATVEAADVWPCVPNGQVNFEDILKIVQAFQGGAFEAGSCPGPCR